MNIFVLDLDQTRAARDHNDKHCVKMILEYAQLLSTAHRLLDGVLSNVYKNGRKMKTWTLSDEREYALYKATHMNHPSAVWVRQSIHNYKWLFRLFRALLQEYTDRYGKTHKCDAMLSTLVSVPSNIPKTEQMTPFALAMPDEYKVDGDAVASYRAYYRGAKAHLGVWGKGTRPAPAWWVSE